MISVVVPIYNEERYIAACLKSLNDQDCPDEYEVIVVDNASTDRGPVIARDFGVRVVSCPRRGTVYARQAGFMAASGGIIVQADADTVYPSDWLSRVADRFSRQPEIVAVAGDVSYDVSMLWAGPLQHLRRAINSLVFRLRGKPATCLACNFAFRREAFVRAGGYNTRLPFIGDEHDLLARLSRCGKVVYDAQLVAHTSSRRFAGRFWQYWFVDMFCGLVLERTWLSLTGRCLSLARACPRGERPEQPSYLPRWAWAVSMLVIMAGFLGWGYFSPTSNVYGKTYDRIAAAEKVVAISFDDGPNEPYTSQILDILASRGVQATFFVVGKNVEFYPAVARRIANDGHVLGNHSYTHRPFTEFDPPDFSELERAQDVIFRVTGVRPRLFRPPFGRKTPWELSYVARAGLVTVTWSISANDPRQPPAASIAERILRQVHPGAIVLLHDGNETRHGADRSRTVAALPLIIESLKAQGYTFVTVPELLGVAPYIYVE